MSALLSDRAPAAADLRSLPDDELAAMYASADEGTQAALVAECERRDQATAKARARSARRNEPVTAEWRDMAYAQYRAAEAACNGELAVKDAPFTDAFALWSGTEAFAMKYATEELRNYWLSQPRITVTAYRAQVRGQEEAYRNDELARDDAGRVRHDPAAAGAAGDVPGAGPVRNAGHDGPDRPRAVKGERMSALLTGGPVTAAGAVPAAMRRAVLTVEHQPIATSYEDIDALDPEWLWPGHFARAEVSILAGDGGIGKGFLIADLVARVTRGDPMPGQKTGERAGHVIMITPEDSPQTSCARRLRAAGAELGMVHDLTETTAGPFEIPGDLPVLRAAIDEIGDVAMVIIDPLSAVSSVSLSTASRVRQQIMSPLQRLARDTGVAIVVIHHTVKSGAIGGSKTITDAARSVMTVTLDEEDTRVRVLEVTKSNIASGGQAAVRYVVEGDWPLTAVTYLPASAADVSEGSDPSLSPALRVASVASDGQPHTAQQVAREAGCAYALARQLLARMENAGQLVQAAPGVYQAA
jgi:AAA domain